MIRSGDTEVRLRPVVGVVHNLKPGGARRVVQEQLAALPFKSEEFCLSTAEPIRDDAVIVSYRPLAPRVRRTLRAPLRYADLAGLTWAWWRLAQRIEASEVDVLLVHPCQFLQAPTAMALSRRPSIYFCHEPRRVDYDAAASTSRNARTRRLYAPLYRAEQALDRLAVRRAAVIVTNSRFSGHAVDDAYGRAAEVLRLGVSERITASRGTRGLLDPQRDGAYVLSVGSLIPSKGHDLAIEAVAASGIELCFVVVAPRHDPVEEQRLSALAQRSHVPLRLEIGITDEALGDLYRDAFATLYLARSEPFGLASIEAQACGSPVIVSDDGGLSETLIDGASGWTTPRDSAHVGRLLRRLLDDDLRDQMRSSAMEHGRSYSWAESNLRMASMLGDVAESRRDR